MHVQRITPFLWFDHEAEEAARFYTAIFDDSEITSVQHAEPGEPATGVTFRLANQEFFALNGGPEFTFTPAVSFFASCETQAEVDELWERLSIGGEPGRCGWLKDRYGLSWQVIPTILGDLLNDPDPARRARVLEAMLSMGKIDIHLLRAAHEGR